MSQIICLLYEKKVPMNVKEIEDALNLKRSQVYRAIQEWGDRFIDKTKEKKWRGTGELSTKYSLKTTPSIQKRIAYHVNKVMNENNANTNEEPEIN